MRHYIGRFIFILSACLFAAGAYATSNLNMPYGVTPMSHDIYNLHMAAFYVCCGIGVVVFGVLIYSLIKFRHSKGVEAKQFHEHLGVEILWTTIPFIILVVLAIPATIVLAHIHNTDESGLTIKVTGFQWKWKYDYLDQGVSFFSNLSTPQEQINNQAPKNPWFLLEVDHPMVVPVNTKVKLLITSNDVIHDWWVPALGVKQDAVPGYINENWFYALKPGIYRGQCGELCGIGHGFMPIVVQAVSQADFAKWVHDHGAAGATATSQPAKTMSEQELLTLGQAKFESTCAMCHQKTGLGLPPSFPALKNSPIVTGPLAKNIATVLHGVPGTAMQAFGDQLDDTTLAAIITYIRHSWGNDVVNQQKHNVIVVQPQDIKKARQ